MPNFNDMYLHNNKVLHHGLICRNNPKWGQVLVTSGLDAHLIFQSGQLVSCRNEEKYGPVPWKMSCDLLPVYGRRRGVRGDPCCRHWAVVQSCSDATVPSNHQQNQLRQQGWWTTQWEGGGQMTTASNESDQWMMPRDENITTLRDFISRWHKYSVPSAFSPTLPPSPLHC